ncbi:glycosyltransferase [Flavobacterium sp. WC2409]|uniref:Glycosyltransferase n=1 Tax=Flavobacterium sp. WC2409 TaxID=3234139 RepID=A0AB39W0X4_9FLAO
MLSILIPIYNYNAYPLVQELQKQCMKCEIDFEILCQDDASQSPLNQFNENINLLPNCNFMSLDKNIAHRENRNSLAKKSKFDNLLFIDGDSIILNTNYIHNYVENIHDSDVIYGGRLHPEKCPSNLQKLRWKYGKFIEDQPTLNRKKTPYKSLLFNNTLIKKKCFNKVKFDKSIIKYGHDDTQLSFQLALLQAKVNHIENPVEHGDIDTNLVYLKKTKEALENLMLLYENRQIDGKFVKLIFLFEWLSNLKLTYLISQCYLFFEKRLIKNLKGNNPNLVVFTLFRIGYFCTIKRS